MARVLIMSSWVAAGHVGLSAATPALQRLGCEVVGLPTTALSNHKGWPRCAGAPTPPAQLAAMRDALDANGLLDGLDAALVGYMPTPAHVDVAAETVIALRAARPGLEIVVDPVLGDDPKGLYLPRDAAEAVAARLPPLADTLTPNRFELAWLSGRPVETPRDAVAAARSLGVPRVIVTSPPCPPQAAPVGAAGPPGTASAGTATPGAASTGALVVTAERATLHAASLTPDAPSGAGDVFAALIAAGCDCGAAVGMLSALVAESAGLTALRVADPAARWDRAPGVDGAAVDLGAG